MITLADTHVHFYPCFDFERGLEAAWKNFERIGVKPACRALYLTERADCHVWRKLREEPRALLPGGGFQVEPHLAPEVLKLTRRGGGEMFLIAGRQISTAERLEVLALHTLGEFEDKQEVEESINRARESGAVIVLNWSLGKWMFRRGRIVGRILSGATQDDFVLGDVPARPLGWGEPRLFLAGRGRGLLSVAGSDPLPFPGEELRIASYLSYIATASDPNVQPDFFRQVLLDRNAERKVLGQRNTPWVAGMRLWRNSQSKGVFPPCRV